MLRHLFVYGTLKEGFCNHHVNDGARVPGTFVTVEAYPLYVVGPWHLPWLVDAPGEGHRVVGELYEVDRAALVRMDELEQVDAPDWYRRGETRVVGPYGAARDVLVYFGRRVRLSMEAVHLGPIPEFGRAHDALRAAARADT